MRNRWIPPPPSLTWREPWRQDTESLMSLLSFPCRKLPMSLYFMAISLMRDGEIIRADLLWQSHNVRTSSATMNWKQLDVARKRYHAYYGGLSSSVTNLWSNYWWYPFTISSIVSSYTKYCLKQRKARLLFHCPVSWYQMQIKNVTLSSEARPRTREIQPMRRLRMCKHNHSRGL